MEEEKERDEACKAYGANTITKLSCEIAVLPPQPNHPTDSLLQRIDQLDTMLAAMEEHNAPLEPSHSPRSTSRLHSSAPTTPRGLEKHRKPTEYLLEEVQEKGTIVERVSDLEKRVMKLQRMLSLKSIENVEYPISAHTTALPHRRVMSHHDTYDQQLLQEPVDVEKHEVPLSHSGPSELKGQYIEPSEASSSHDTHSTKSVTPDERYYEDTVAASGKGSDAEKEYPKAPPQQPKKKRLRIRKWLSKRLHFHFPGTSQDKHSCSNGHCWRPQIHPKNCCNVRKRELNTSQYTHYGHMSTDEE